MNDMSGFRRYRSPREPRPLVEAIRRGLLGRCPACGRGRLFCSYLKLQAACKVCGEDLSHARADDAPAYLTMLIMCHVACGGVLLTDDSGTPLMTSAVIWLTVAVVVSLLILPRLKGAVVGQQWALGMHGFGGDET